MTARRTWCLYLTVAAPGPAYAHGPADPAAGLWNLDPWILAPLLIAATAYAMAAVAAARGGHRRLRLWQPLCFAAGLAALFAALIWPLEVLSATSFSAHMVQHTLLIAVAAPLLVLGGGGALWLRAVPRPLRRPLFVVYGPLMPALALLTRPVVAFLLHGAAIWAWHAPGLFDAALDNDLVHLAEHASFLATGLLFWWSVVHSGHGNPLGYGEGAFWTLATVIHTGMLGVLLTFAHQPLYRSYEQEVRAWGLTPLADQQLAGLIMWVPAGLIYVAAGVALVALWLRAAATVVAAPRIRRPR